MVREALELDARRERIGVRVVGDEVPAPEVRRVHAELRRGEIDDPLGERGGNRVADRAVLAGHVLVGEDDVQLRAVLPVRVRPAGQVDHLVALDPAGARVDRVRPDCGQVVEVEREDLPVLAACEPHLRAVLARMNVGEEGLEPVGNELHRAAEDHRDRRGRHLVGIDVHLDAVRAADVLADHPHVRLGDAEVTREDVLHHVRRLGRVIDGQRVVRGVVVGEDRARLHADAGVAAEAERLLDDEVGLRERVVDRTGVELAPEADVVAEIRMDDVAVGARVLHVGHDRQLLPLRLDVAERVLALLARLGDDRGHRLALPARALDRDRVLRRRLDALQVREHRHPRRAVLRHRAAVEARDHAGLARRLRQIELLEPGVGIRAAEEDDVREAREAQVVHERAAPLEQALRVRAGHALPDVALVGLRSRRVQRKLGAGVHRLPPLAFSSTSCTASTIA